MIISILRYGILFVLTIFILVTLSFALAHLFPGELVTNLSGKVPANAAEMALLTEKWAINQSTPERFLRYCSLFLAGDWGVSMASNVSLYSEIGRTLPATVELSLYAVCLSLVIGIPVGCWAGIRAYSKTDYIINSFSLINYSMPVFWLGLALILIFSLNMNWLPLSGRISLLFDVPHNTGFIIIDILMSDLPDKTSALSNALAHLAMPTLAVASIASASLIRMVRRSVIDILDKPYIASARSRGLSSKDIFFHHVLRNALMPVLPLLALQITTLVTNAIVIETIFSWPGIGDWLIQAIYQRDYSAIRMGVLIVAIAIISLTIFVDILNRLIDPSKRMPSNVQI